SPYFDDMLDSGLERFLAGKKYVPEIFDVKKSTLKNAEKMSGSEKLSRKVVYRPEKPVLDGSVYEGKGEFRITVKFFIDEGGRVIKAEPVNTTGFPEVDNLAVQFVRGWMFEPRDNVPEEGQRQETDIVLVTEDRI
ncbi:MAG: energy transducer TonB, partial [Candidatus Omnitrophica bacterium]|nr:energy transducer TonB [Candidatus Omnitrophota bacterium]